MRFLILSDIHANWYALQSVLADAEGEYDEALCCGDLVGYNPHPGPVIDWVSANCKTVIRGNHDKVVAGLEDAQWFNDVARTAALWTIGSLAEGQLDYLRNLPHGPGFAHGFSLCHGAISDEDEYVTNASQAAPHFAEMEGDLIFFGHTHLQGGFMQRRRKTHAIGGLKKTERERTISLEVDTQYMINPGSVGQPRDADSRAAYAFYDSDAKVVTLKRVEYPIARTAADIQAAGLPEVLAVRLFHGL